MSIIIYQVNSQIKATQYVYMVDSFINFSAAMTHALILESKCESRQGQGKVPQWPFPPNLSKLPLFLLNHSILILDEDKLNAR